MFCPNCGARNNKKQNYCRFCGLRLSAIEKLFLDQLIFGEDSKRLKTLRNVKKLSEYLAVLLFALTFVGLFAWFFYDSGIGKTLTRASLLAYFLLQGASHLIGYFQRQNAKKNQKSAVGGEVEPGEFFNNRETQKLIEDKPPPERVPNIGENSTEPLRVDRRIGKTKWFDKNFRRLN